MNTLEKIRANSSLKDVFEGQLPHLGIVILMFFGATSLLMPRISSPVFWGWDSTDWAIASIWLAIIHQVIVAVVFRFQLHYNIMTRLFGASDMLVWRAIFMPLLIARPLSLIAVGWLDPNPISGWRSFEILLGVTFLILAVLTMHSVLKYFTIERALGGDHFRDHIIHLPLVREGMFKYTKNGMYGIAFLGLWGIALCFGSWNALIVALFQHGYIWVHMYVTETPDMRRIYG